MKEINKERVRATAKKVAKEIEKGAKNTVAVVSGVATAIAPVVVPVVAVGAGVVLGYVLTSCNNSTNPEPVPETIPEANPCACPNGTLHLVGEECCDGDDCTCEKNVAGQRSSNGIAITDRAGIGNISTAVTNINTALGNLAGGYSANTLKKNVKEITIVAVGAVSYNFASQTISIGVSAGAINIQGAFEDYLDEPGIVAMLQNGNKVPTPRELIRFEKQFNRSQAIVRANMGRGRSQRVWAS